MSHIREYKVGYPNSFSVLNANQYYEGERYLYKEAGQDLDVVLKLEGEDINESNPHLAIQNREGVVGGRHFLRRLGTSEGEHKDKALPRAFSEPFEFVYQNSHSDNLSFEDYKGQAGMGVRQYEKLDVKDHFVNRYNNFRIFSFKGDLFFCGEVADQERGQQVHVGRYNDQEGTFSVLNKFGEYVDEGKVGELENGSPDIFEHDGGLFIAYRTLNRTREENYIVLYKMDNDDSTKWEKKNKFKIENTYKPSDYQNAWHDNNDKRPIYFNRFRLRLASDGDNIVLAFMALKQGSSGGVFDVRSYVSYDGGTNFETKDDNYRKFKEKESQSEQTQKFIIEDNDSSFADLFIPFSYGTSEYYQQEVSDENYFTVGKEEYILNVNFDLYYDRNMAAFVIVKSGDPYNHYKDGKVNDNYGNGVNIQDEDRIYASSYLMMIRTTDESLHDWQTCCEYPLDYQATGISNSSDPYDESMGENNGKYHQYRINNVEVIPSESYNTLCMWVKEPYKDGDGFQSVGVVTSEFSFVHETQIGPGMKDDVDIHYGSKYHDEWWFVSSVINLDMGGVVSPGNRFDYENSDYGAYNFFEEEFNEGSINQWNVYNIYLAGARWKNAPVLVTKRENEKGFTTFYKPYSNLAEKVPYEFNAFNALYSLKDFGGVVYQNGGEHDFLNQYNNARAFDEFSSYGDGDGDSTSYIEFSSNKGPGFPLEREGDRYKVKFDFEISHTDGIGDIVYEICQIDHLQDNVGSDTYPRLVADNRTTDGWKLDLYEIDGSFNPVRLGNVIPATDFSADKKYTVLVSYGLTDYDTDPQMMVFWKEADSQIWHRGYNASLDGNLTNSLGLGKTPKVRIGNIFENSSSSGISDEYIYTRFYSLFMSNYSSGYRSLYGEQEGEVYGIPPTGRRSNNPKLPYQAGEIKAYDNQVELDGEELVNLEGGYVEEGESDFFYRKAMSRNTPKNIFNGSADIGYDFTKQTDTLTLDLENEENGHYIDYLSVVNLSGIHKIELDYGDSHGPILFDVGYKKLDLEKSKDFLGYFFLSEDKAKRDLENAQTFEKGELKGRTVMKYDSSTDTYVGSAIVKENFENVIGIGTDYYNIENDDKYEYHLMDQSIFENFDKVDLSKHGSENNLSVTFYSIDDATIDYNPLRYIGELSIGTVVDLTGYLSEVDRQNITESEVQETDFGLGFPVLDREGLFYTSYDLTFPDLTKKKGGVPKIHNRLLELSKKEFGFPVFISHSDSDYEIGYGVIGEGLSFGVENEVTSNILLQDWKQKSTTEIENEPPKDVKVSADQNRLATGETVNFDVTARDPEGEPLSYEWDFGDGHTSTVKQPSHSFGSEGVYKVSCQVSDSQNKARSDSMKIYVGPKFIDHYTDDAPTNAGFEQNIDVTIIAEDIDGDKVDNSSIKLVINDDDAAGDVKYDVNQDGAFSREYEERNNRLYQGEATFRIRNDVKQDAKTVEFIVEDSYGRTHTFSMAFSEWLKLRDYGTTGRIDVDSSEGSFRQLFNTNLRPLMYRDGTTSGRVVMPIPDPRYKGLSPEQQQRLLFALREDTLIADTANGYPAHSRNVAVPSGGDVITHWKDATNSGFFFEDYTSTSPEYTASDPTGVDFGSSVKSMVWPGTPLTNTSDLQGRLHDTAGTLALRSSFSASSDGTYTVLATGVQGNNGSFVLSYTYNSGSFYLSARFTDSSGATIYNVLSQVQPSSGYDDIVVVHYVGTDEVVILFNGEVVLGGPTDNPYPSTGNPYGDLTLGSQTDGTNGFQGVLQGVAFEPQVEKAQELLNWISGNDY